METKEERGYAPYYLVFPFDVLKREGTNKTDCLVYAVIYYYENMEYRKCIASNERIGEILDIAASTVGESLRRLEVAGCIERLFRNAGKFTRERIKTLIPIRDRDGQPIRKKNFTEADFIKIASDKERTREEVRDYVIQHGPE